MDLAVLSMILIVIITLNGFNQDLIFCVSIDSTMKSTQIIRGNNCYRYLHCSMLLCECILPDIKHVYNSIERCF